MSKAAKKMGQHVTNGLILGALLGSAIPFRKRWAQRPFSAAAKARAAATGAKPQLYYPSAASKLGSEAGAKGAAEGGEQIPKNPVLVLFAKAVGFGMAGAFIGSLLGMASGRAAGAKIIKEAGMVSRLEQVMKEVERKISDNSLGTVDPAFPVQARLPKGSDTSRAGDKRLTRMEEREAGFDKPDQGEGRLGDGASSSAVKAATQSMFFLLSHSRQVLTLSIGQPSRWDELRKSQAAQPSSWDKIRETEGRASLPPSVPNSSPDAYENTDATPTYVSDDDAAREKEERRRAFEEMLERERAGGDDDSKKWRR
jgi:hypothetical protein